MGQAALQTWQIKNGCVNFEKILEQMVYQVVSENIIKVKNSF